MDRKWNHVNKLKKFRNQFFEKSNSINPTPNEYDESKTEMLNILLEDFGYSITKENEKIRINMRKNK